VIEERSNTMSDAWVVDTTSSPHALLQPVPVPAVTLGNGFWRPRLEANRRVGIPAFLQWLDQDDQTAPFRSYSRRRQGFDEDIGIALQVLKRNWEGRNAHRLPHHWRGNTAAWLEACAWSLASDPDPGLRSLLDEFVQGVVTAHKDDAFLDTYYGQDFEHSYQLATPGHLIQAAIAHKRTSGSGQFLDCAASVADRVLERFTGDRYADHPCIEMALVELYRSTGCRRYLDGANHFLAPLLQQPPVIGPDVGDERSRHLNRHVVRQTYLCAGGADYCAETGDEAFRRRLSLLFDDMVTGKLQITGRLATDPECAERITRTPFELSSGVFGDIVGTVNHGFEACEAVGNMFWNWRMLALTGDAKHSDLFERILYNGLLSHISLDGSSFYYLSPLASRGDHPPRTIRGHPSTSCCPPNLLRVMASLPGYFYSTSADGLWVHLYDESRLEWHLPDGTPFNLVQSTDYPWSGQVVITLEPERPVTFSLNLRVPEWCINPTVVINGHEVVGAAVPGSYARLQRTGAAGDRGNLDLQMPVMGMVADHRAREFRGKVALMRGPLVYCFEGVDNPHVDVWGIRPVVVESIPRVTITGRYSSVGEWSGASAEADLSLLHGAHRINGPTIRGGPSGASAIPYFAWANREPSPMSVWVGE